MPETSITKGQIEEIIDSVEASNEAFQTEMNTETEHEFWNEVDERVKFIGGAGLPR